MIAGFLASFSALHEVALATWPRPVSVDGAGAQVVVVVGQVGVLADHADAQRAGQPALAQAGVQHRRFDARVGPDEQDTRRRPRCLAMRRVEQPAFARTAAQRHAVLAAVEALVTPSPPNRSLRGLHGLRVLQVAGDHADAVGLAALSLVATASKRLGPGRRRAACRSRG